MFKIDSFGKFTFQPRNLTKFEVRDSTTRLILKLECIERDGSWNILTEIDQLLCGIRKY